MAIVLDEICHDPAPFCNFTSLCTEHYSQNYLRNWSKRWVPACYWSNRGISGDPILGYYIQNLVLIPNSHDLFQRLDDGTIVEIPSYSSLEWKNYCRANWPFAHNPNSSISHLTQNEAYAHTSTNELIFPLLWHSDHNHYWHFTFDIVFRLFYLTRKLPQLLDKITLLVIGQDQLKPFQHQLIQAILGNQYKIKYCNHPFVCSEAVYIAPSHTLLQNQSWLRQYSDFLQNSLCSSSPLISFSASSNFSSINSRKIYIKRGKAANPRHLTNESDLIAILKERDFDIIDPGTLSLKDQTHYFNSSSLVLGLHGAAFTNLLYMSTNSKIIELTNSSYDPFTLFLLGKQLDLMSIRICTKTYPDDFLGHMPFTLNLEKVTRYLELYC